MAAVVIIQRDVEAEKQEELFDLLRKLRAKAVPQPGYMSGETLFSTSKGGTHLVISRWPAHERRRSGKCSGLTSYYDIQKACHSLRLKE